MSVAVRVRSVAVAAAVLFALAACAPGAEPDPAPTVTVTASATDESDAAVTDSGADPSATPEGAAGEPTSPEAPPAVSPADPPADPPAATPTAAPPAATPNVAVTSQQCTSGKLKITLTASYDNSYRKGISSVVFERQNNENAWVDSDATWLGPETGQGNQWTGNPPGHENQGYQDELRITAKASGGATTVLVVAITANC